MNMPCSLSVDVLCIVARYVCAAWLSPRLLTHCLRSDDRVSLILRNSVDRCASCACIVREGTCSTKRVQPCGCLVHAPCVLDGVVDMLQRNVRGPERFQAWKVCPRCGDARSTDLETWMHEMSIVDCRFFMLQDV
jgi:hypothetical protein